MLTVRQLISGILSMPLQHTKNKNKKKTKKEEEDRQCTYNVTLKSVHVTTAAVKSNNYYISVCVCERACVHVALLIQHKTRMRHIMT
jgi:hypothetical protein